MSLESNKQLVKRAIMMWSTGKVQEADEIYAPNCSNYQQHLQSADHVLKGPESWKKFIQEFRQVFPDYQDTIEVQIAESDMVASRLTCRGTHKGKWHGVQPTGKKVSFTCILLDRIENGKIVETWANWDMYGLMLQLGVIKK